MIDVSLAWNDYVAIFLAWKNSYDKKEKNPNNNSNFIFSSRTPSMKILL